MLWLVGRYSGLDAFCQWLVQYTYAAGGTRLHLSFDSRIPIGNLTVQFNSLISRHIAQITFSVCRSADHILASLRSTLPTGLDGVNVHGDNAIMANGISHHPGHRSTGLHRGCWLHVLTQPGASHLQLATLPNLSPRPPRCPGTGLAV